MTVPAAWLGGAVTALPYTLLPPYFGFQPAAASCGVPLVMGVPSTWPTTSVVPPAVATVPTVPCVQPLSPEYNTAGELSPGGPSSDDTRRCATNANTNATSASVFLCYIAFILPAFCVSLRAAPFLEYTCVPKWYYALVS